MSKVLDYNNLDIDRLVYKNPIKQRGGYYLSEMFYNYGEVNQPIIIQTPKLKLASQPILNDSRSYIDLLFDKDSEDYYNFLCNLDDANIKEAYSNAETWFSQDIPLEIIDEFYNTQIKLHKKHKNIPYTRIKIPVTKGTPMCKVFDANKEELSITDLKEDDTVILIIELNGIRFLKQQFLCDWNLIQLKKCEMNKKNIIFDECIIDDTSDYIDPDICPDADDIDIKYSNEEIDNMIKSDLKKKQIEKNRILKLEERRKNYELAKEEAEYAKIFASEKENEFNLAEYNLRRIENGEYSDSESDLDSNETINSLVLEETNQDVLPVEQITQEVISVEQSNQQVVPVEQTTQEVISMEENNQDAVLVEQSAQEDVYVEENTQEVVPVEQNTEESHPVEQNTREMFQNIIDDNNDTSNNINTLLNELNSDSEDSIILEDDNIESLNIQTL